MPTDPAQMPAGPERLLALLDAGRVARGSWTGTDAEGRRTLCALAALSDEVAERHQASACPADVAPEWLAPVIPSIDDRVSVEAWEPTMRRLGALAGRWHVLDETAWERVRTEWLCVVLDEAESHVAVDEWGVREAIEGVRTALRAGEDLAAAARAAGAAGAAARAASEAAWAASEAAWAAASDAASDAAWAAASDAAWAASEAAWAGPWAAKAAKAARAAARAAAWDRLAGTLLDLIETEVIDAE